MAMSLSDFGQLLRNAKLKKKKKLAAKNGAGSFGASKNESAQPTISQFREASTLPAVTPENPAARRIDVLLITEGLGNRVNMNYYGPEAMNSAPAVFEGAPMFFNHDSRFGQQNLPERDVRDMCGYYRNVRVETITAAMATQYQLNPAEVGKLAVRADGNFENTDGGKLAYDKAVEAINYRKNNPNAEHEYLGISINADGDSDRRTVSLGGVMTEVNYVLAFKKGIGTSADEVTLPARGGKFLACLESHLSKVNLFKPAESMAGYKQKTQKETQMKEAIKAIALALSEAVTKHKSIEAAKTDLDKVQAMLKEAEKCEDESEAGSDGAAFNKLKADHEALKAEHGALLQKHAQIGAALDNAHKVMHGIAPDADGKDADADDTTEESAKPSVEESEKSKALVDKMLKESGLDGLIDAAPLYKKSLKAIESEIAREKKRLEMSTGAAGNHTAAKKTEAVKISNDACKIRRND